MANVFDYLDWRGDLEFSQSPFCEIDSLILSLISYVDFDGIVSNGDGKKMSLLDAARAYVRAHRGKPMYVGLIVPPEVVSLMAKAAKSKRFGSLLVCAYENRVEDEAQMQFCAMTYTAENGVNMVAFRGTDDSLVGWKENLNMSFRAPVPAQLRAVEYLEERMHGMQGDFILCGHSKGGNLAVYSAVSCDAATKSRIRAVYSNDGPGFTKEFIADAAYLDMRPKIRTLVPQSSVVGMLLEHEENYEVVKSTQSGLLQHNAFSWEVLGPNFIHLDTVTKESKFIDKTIKKWLSTMPAEERERFVENLYTSLSVQGAKTLTDLSSNKAKIIKVWSGLDAGTREAALKYIKLLFRETAKGVLKKKSSADKKKTPAKKSPRAKT